MATPGSIHHSQIQACASVDQISDRLTTLESYLRRGWGLVPLHDVSAGACSCGQQCGKSAGKHPRFSGWQNAPLRDVGAFRAHPAWNVGIATGRTSGHWVLDWDPADADDAGRSLHVALNAIGLAPHVRTGSSGEHRRFLLPDWEIRNRQGTARTHRLPRGWDVRGDGGQVVAPPSISARGPYLELHGGEPYTPPAWLLELIRPSAAALPGVAPGRNTDRSAGIPAPVPLGGIPGLDPDGDRKQAYSRAGITAALGEYAALDDGRRGEAAWATCMRVVELARLGGFGLEGVEEAWLGAVAAASDNTGGTGGLREHEARRTFARAVAEVGQRAAVMPADGGIYATEVLPIPQVAAPVVPPFVFAEPGSLPAVDPATLAAQARAEPPIPNDPVDALIAEMLTPDELDDAPNPVPLIMGVLDLNTTAWLIGRSGSYKSFVAIDWAGHVGCGIPWQGRPVRQGVVIYICAEGAPGFKLRKRAWEKTYGPMKDVRVLPRPVQADERRGIAEWSVLVEACRRLHPTMVVIDTQARVTAGLEENSNTDMGFYVEQADRIKRATGACVLTVHHSGRNGTAARGASAIDAAQDTEVRVERTADQRVLLHMDKQKDQSDEGSVPLALTRVDGGRDPDTGRDLSSLVVAAPLAASPDAPDWVRNLSAHQASILAVMVDHFRAVGGTKAEALALVWERFGKATVPRTSFNTAWAKLIEKQLLIRVEGTARYALASVLAAYERGELDGIDDGSDGTPS